MNYLITPSAVTGGKVAVPGDKSISHRALLLGAIAEGRTTIHGFLAGEDCLATLTALRAMGVTIEQLSDTCYAVDGVGLRGLTAASGDIDLGNSGTAMRLFTGLLSAQDFSSRLIGDSSLSQRPMNRVIGPLSQMGAQIRSQDGKPPIQIDGGTALAAINYAMPVASAQVKSALLLAGLYASGEIIIREPAVSRDHTERMLETMGVQLQYGEGRITMPGGQQPLAWDVEVPADLSSATFAILATIISANGMTTVSNVGVNPTRTGVIEILRAMGASIEVQNVRLLGQEPVADIHVSASRLQGIEVDPSLVSLAIDEFPALFIAAAVAEGKTYFSGIGELRVKESDRIGAMTRGLQNLGIHVIESPETAVVTGGQFTGGTVESHGDHRVAMSFAVAGSIAREPVCVLDAGAVNTSFPGFVERMRSIGLDIVQTGEGAA